MDSLLIIQPYLTKYRVPVFRELIDYYDVTVAACLDKSFGEISEGELADLNFRKLNEIKILSGRFIWQTGVLRNLVSIRPKVVFMSANPRYITLWLTLVVAKLLSIRVLLHGQGLYNKVSPHIMYRIQYALFGFFCEKYICYTESCELSLSSMRLSAKTVVAHNSIDNKYPVEKLTTDENGILFVGRIRKNSNLNFLIGVIDDLVKTGTPLSLHIVGGGDDILEIRKQWLDCSFVNFYGEIYDSKKISEISRLCFAGCYPGDAGLSVLHYMSLSLPPIVHSSMCEHMGPEPSYINNGHNGMLFEKNCAMSLSGCVKNMKTKVNMLNAMQSEAFSTYQHITSPSLGRRIKFIIDDVVLSGR